MGKLLHRDLIVGYVFLSPFLIGFLAFTLFPIMASFYFSFTKFDLLSAPNWIGLDNFYKMFKEDDRFWQALKVTFIYVSLSVPLRLCFALFVAMLLNAGAAMLGLYRTVYYLPSIIGGSVAVAIMWRQIFGDRGAVNSILALFDIHVNISWTGHPSTALFTLVLLSVWQFGSSMLIFLAGLKNIPRTFYEAASVDGAGAVQKFFKITLPLLSPIVLFNLIMQTIAGFMTFTPAYIISNGSGGPMGTTLLYSLYLFQRAFVFFDMGYASAMAWVMLALITVLTGFVFFTSKYWVYYETKEDRA